MKIVIFLIALSLVHSIDYCTEYTTYEDCIATKVDQCRWMPLFSECIRSDNYLMGCDTTLSEKLCIKQIGTVLGELAQCVFQDTCHKIPDPFYAQCYDIVTRSGCLSISNIDQRCKWEDHQCKQLSDDDYRNLQSTFMDKEFSVSVCPLITGFLVMHHTVLWPLIEYEPDLIAASDDLVLEDEGKYVEETPTYQTTGQMQNNYVDSTGNYVWYSYKVTKASTATNFKINDSTRYGCIAVEVLSDSQFLTLFSLRGTIQGVNHIYCKYLSRHPTDPQLTIFNKNQCITITQDQLKDDLFIKTNQITCQQMGGYVCQRLMVESAKCMIYGSSEYDCLAYNANQQTSNTACEQRNGVATYYQCMQSDYCFLNIQTASAYCDNVCHQNKLSASGCQLYTQCVWSGETQIDLNTPLVHCLPYNGCSTIGLSKQYCADMALQCYWNEDKQKCEDSENVAILTCEEANTFYTCTTITRYDQYCIWYKNACINIKNQPLISYFKSLPQGVMMNRHACVQMESEYYTYIKSTKMCLQSKQITMKCLDKSVPTYTLDKTTADLPCTNVDAQNINKYFCLNFLGQYTKWDQNKLICLNLAESQLQKSCETFKLVNPQVCSKTIVPDTHYCFYDDKMYNCYTVLKSTRQLQCTDKGLDKTLCTSITTQGQYCQWSYGMCRSLVYRQILPYKCNSLLSVNGNACAYFTTEVSCLYDPNYTSCAVGYGPESKCTNNLNPQGCQESTASCYYDFLTYKCRDTNASILNQLKCAGSYLSKTACSQVTTPNQACIWNSNSKCSDYTSQFSVTCTTYDSANPQVCKYLQSSFVNYYLDGTYCELVAGVCTASRTTITGCGTTTEMNVHRCAAYTTGSCFYDSQNQCTQLPSDGYLNILMNYLNCTQVNINVCGLVQTKGQTCWVVDNNSNIKCSYYSSSQVYTCAQLSAINTSNAIGVDGTTGKRQWFNRNMCYLATDSCYFDIPSGKCKQDLSVTLPCDNPGLNKISCLTQTKGQCAFNNRTCEYISDLTIACELRNQEGCMTGVKQCIWNTTTSKCNTSTDYSFCPVDYSVTSYLTCGIASTSIFCWAFVDGCLQDDTIVDLPCNLSLNQGVCSSQQHMCFWINNRCTAYNPEIHICMNALTLGECMLNLTSSEYCAYSSNICFAVDPTTSRCDQYDQVSVNYCLQFPECIYDTTKFKCVDVKLSEFYASKQMDTKNISGVVCDYADVMHCIYQKSAACYPMWGRCGTLYGYAESCPTDYESYWGDEMSIQYCTQFDNCLFLGSRDGMNGLCYQESISCEQLNQYYCVKDFPNLACTFNYDNSVCETILEDINCDTIIGMNVNRKACLMANANSVDSQCYFYEVSDSEKFCKKLQRKSDIACEDVNTNYADNPLAQQVHCTMTDNQCYVAFDAGGIFQECSSSSSTTSQPNRQTCIQQTDDTYIFNLQTYKCDTIDNTTILQSCDHLNKNACLTLTNVYPNFKCVWSSNRCRQMVASDADTLDCNSRNKYACLQTLTLKCTYSSDTCSEYIDTLLCADLTSVSVSPMVCQEAEAGCLYNSVSCFKIAAEPKSYHKCSYLALSQDQCLTKTSYLNCYWNGTYCNDANLFTITCSDQVSQQTCLNIETDGQFCKWGTNGCESVPPEQPCSSYSSLNNSNGCISLITKNCYYDFNYDQCRDSPQVYEVCYEGLSKLACRMVKNQACVISDNKCTNITSTQFECSQIYNKFGCLYIDLSCIWDDVDGCKQFSDMVKCNQMPKGVNKYGCINNATPISGESVCDECNCSFNDETLSCSYRLKGVKILNFENIDQTGYEQIRLTKTCPEMLNYFDCINNLVGKCKWSSSRCSDSDFQGCDYQSKWACMDVGDSFCSWRDSTCIPWNKNQFQTALVTSNVCRLLDQSLNAKYSYEKQSCIPTDFNTDNCSIVSVTKVTCLSIINYACLYDNGTCLPWAPANNQYARCSDYANVTSKVCQQALTLACKYNATTFTCAATTPQDSCSTIGLSKLGCISVVTEPCFWNGTQCQRFVSNPVVDQCDTKTIVNGLACSSIAYLTNPCSYDSVKHVCTPHFNKQSKCNTPGLNQYACYLSESEPCLYKDGRCIKFGGGDWRCFQLQQVNNLVCRSIVSDTCAYELTTHSCFSVLNFVTCNTPGVNINACSTLENCAWNNDDTQCQCNLIKHKDICYQANKDTCLSQSQCFYYQGNCYKKRCKHLQGAQCTGIVSDESCYLNQDGQCQGAKKCEDIVYLDSTFDCPSFIFSGSACVTINYYCVSATNLAQICVNSNCSNNSCKLEQGICRPLSCSDWNEQDCYLQQACAFINEQCIEVKSCIEITDPQVCKMVTIDNKPCSWEEYRMLDDTKICTNSQCELYGPAYTICNGNEINGKTCVLTQLIKCKMCEEITDVCICNNSNNACSYINGQCKSIFCGSFVTETECSDSKRCYWSQQDKVCRKMCVQNIRQDQCEALIYECHWNPYMRLCEQGVEVIPDLSVDIDVDEQYAIMFSALIILLII